VTELPNLPTTSRDPFAGKTSRDVDLAVGSVLGLRWWSFTHAGLRGVFTAWHAGVNEAGCLQFTSRLPHLAPHEGCGCGFYAYWDVAEARVPSSILSDRSASLVVGIVEGYGSGTLLGDLGFRSRYARVVALAAPLLADRHHLANRRRAGLALLRQTFEVPVYDDLEELLERHPPTPDYLASGRYLT